MLRTKSIFYVCLTGLILVVVVLCVNQFVKYMEGHTTYVEKREQHGGVIRYPHFSFCPGFKVEEEGSSLWAPRTVTSVSGLYSVQDDDSAAKNKNSAAKNKTVYYSEETILAIWEASTFSLEEVMTTALIQKSDFSLNQAYVPSKGGEQPDCLSVTQHDTMLGRCYTLSVPCSARQEVPSLAILFNLSATTNRRMSLYVYDEFSNGHLGLNHNFWTLPVKWEKLSADSMVEYGMQKKVRKNAEGVSVRDYMACVNRALVKNLDQVIKSNRNFCWSPSFGSLLNYSAAASKGVASCLSRESTQLATGVVIQVVRLSYRARDCHRPRQEASYAMMTNAIETSSKETRGTSQGIFYYDSTDVIMSEEYVLLDLGTLLSTFGGVIGMFLGWSALGIVESMCSKLNHQLIKN